MQKNYDERFSRGIFWFLCSFDEEYACDFSEAELLALSVPCGPDGRAVGVHDFNSRRGNAFNHKAAWPSLVKDRRELRRHAWNYFPRGRVEIAGGKATIYLNINILQHAGFQEEIADRFHLDGLKIRVVVDNSSHYHCHADDERIS